jgi:MFS family permease
MDAVAPGSHSERDLGRIVGDGVAFSVMVGIGETYLSAFALAAGLGELVAGLVATLPILVGAVLQLVSPTAVRLLGSHRRWVVLCARLQALSFAPLVVGALAGGIGVGWLFFAAAAYWGFGMATGPAWNAWVEALVPSEIRARFFASRTRWAQAALFVAVMTGGGILERASGRGGPLSVFAVLFALAAGARLVSAQFLSRQSEPAGLRPPRGGGGIAGARSRLRGPAGLFLLYLLAMQASVYVAAPFFTPYMLESLHLSYARFTVLTAAAFAARIAILPLWGRIAHRRGSAPVFRLGAVGIVPLPLLWLLSHSFPYLVALQLVAGAAWAALELATTLAFFERLEASDRIDVLTLFNLGNALALAAGAVGGSLLFAYFARGPEAYAVLFAASSAARAAALLLLRRAEVPAEVHAAPLRTLAVRPSLGAVQRPVLASLDESEREDDDAAIVRHADP